VVDQGLMAIAGQAPRRAQCWFVERARFCANHVISVREPCYMFRFPMVVLLGIWCLNGNLVPQSERTL